MSEAPNLPPLPNEDEHPLEKLFTISEIEKYKSAPMKRRVLAFMLDKSIVFVLSFLVSQSFSAKVPFIANFIIIPFLYWVFLPMKFDATPGKTILGLRIVRFDDNLKPSWKQMIMRESVGRWCSLLVVGMGYIWCLFNKEKRTWHDLMSNTHVIEKR